MTPRFISYAQNFEDVMRENILLNSFDFIKDLTTGTSRPDFRIASTPADNSLFCGARPSIPR